jgi:2-C-methyl-D-erythritol 4-phosphate cytidylyltransferase
MKPTLIVPAAGSGTRLGGGVPKALVPIAGVPMIRRVLDLYSEYVSNAVVVVRPDAKPAVAAVTGPDIRVALQPEPTGMLDAILLAAPHVEPGAAVWISWCDQVLVHRTTIRTLVERMRAHPQAALVMPTVRRSHPYIHFERDSSGRIARVLQKREGDRMPDVGESDMGLFALSAQAYETLLPSFAGEASRSEGTAERNFLPFIPWIAERREVVTFPATGSIEAMGVNTPDELAAAEAYLRARDSSK